MDIENVSGTPQDMDVDSSKDIKEGKEALKVPQESVDFVVNRFSELYGVDIDKEKAQYDLYFLDHKSLGEDFASEIIKDSIGMDVKITKEDIQGVLQRQNQMSGEWIQSRNFGIIFASVKERLGQEGVNRTISHEVVHAISSSDGGGFVGGSFVDRLMSGRVEAFDPRLHDLNEGVTEILALGVYLNTTDIEVLREDIMKRVDKGIEEKSTKNIHLPYLMQVKDVLTILKHGDISMSELAQYYMKGDYNGLGGHARETIAKQEPDLQTCSDEELNRYWAKQDTLHKSLDSLGIRFEFD